MEQSRTREESARRIGPYRLITRLDPPSPAVPCRRFIARTQDGGRTVLLSAPLPGADPARFAAEADAARRLLGPWIAPVTDLADLANPADPTVPGETPWYATPYVPALPLPVALAVHGGPLPEPTVRAVGAALAEALAAAHAQGLTHAGVSPAAALLTADGPRLTCFGAVRAACADGEARTGLPGLDPGALAPEQASGGRPRPPGDVFALGAVLAYAATGHTVPERDELPPALRPIVSACLARDPADRPTAAALMTALAPPTTHGTVLNSAGTLLAPGWLPGRVVAALARQSSELLAAELPTDTSSDTSSRT
ncbi:serine/threonine protein kinase [Streptomyces vietnamensis]|uniref:Serine/threonine protein kinase n=1 Tax=Streptomyces vietnamensis TaxID=362257 RepID=A0A0B5HTQ5_9ACTN|nr:serine/threonine protein kinase [Streptomyces vietnamensis]AJF65430.1 serine/threonine protein kinase [Streptomyces vietnamensis]